MKQVHRRHGSTHAYCPMQTSETTDVNRLYDSRELPCCNLVPIPHLALNLFKHKQADKQTNVLPGSYTDSWRLPLEPPLAHAQ